MSVKTIMLVVATLFFSSQAAANKLTVDFELPSFDTADYHKPYVAIWVESKEKKETLLLWHLTKRKEDKWLVDIRRWWRKIGRYGETPDGVTGATKGPGKYSETFDIQGLDKFTLLIEVVREDGGRSLLKQKIDFNDAEQSYRTKANKELGNVLIKKEK